MSPKPADSWYEATARRDAPLPPLEGDIDADVCVVGAGLSGCSTALHLAAARLPGRRCSRPSASGTALRAAPAARSSRAGPAGMEKLVAQLGRSDAKRLWDFSIEGVELTRDLIQRNRIDCDLAWGHVHVAHQTAPARGAARMAARAGRRVRLPQAALHGARRNRCRWIASERYIAGLLRFRAPATCIRSRYTIGVGTGRDRGGRAPFRAQPRHRDRARADRHGAAPAREACARSSSRSARMSATSSSRERLAQQADRRRFLHRRHQAARRRARASAPQGQHRGRRPQLDHRLLPAARQTTACCSAAASATPASTRSAPSARRGSAC